MVELIVVALFGGMGALLRVALSEFKGYIPWGILLANTLATALAAWALLLAPQFQLIVIAGLAGGLSTFSTFIAQTWELLRDGKRSAALINVALNLLFSFTAVYLVLLWQ
jgi:CrcB protein